MAEDLSTLLNKALGKPDKETMKQSCDSIKAWYEAEAAVVTWARMNSPVGILYVAQTEHGIAAITFGRGMEPLLQELDPRARLVEDPGTLAPTLAQLEEYFAGARTRFDLPVDLSRLTDFQREVLDRTARINSGEVWTYKDVAEAIGRPRASRAVGTALARNPVPIVIPCHRVIGSDGKMHGYSGGGGVQTKLWLLNLEGASLG